ncbi:polysaccharide deacetylase family protein [Arthrobacter agilis]|uniref:polysaccharide deacetylase family protein n=1 Tax=Arthrobacter agilis TaxID=37921 RepID=UPI0027869EB6|nr:polysaccharide deacetylase family protein [Arthrobacter agilis]MDQ0734893.1 peptidoglycan/xylan/chitin deacetylase (PgdA/CDA1 family) [Arthrobacter agilis]
MSTQSRADELESYILDQGGRPGGAPVVLLDDAAVATGADPSGLIPGVFDPLPELLRRPAPFSYEAYVLQSVLGELLLESEGAGWSRAELRAVPLVTLNFHDVSPDHREATDRRLAKLARLGDLLGDGGDGVLRPRVVVLLFDGYKDAAEMVVPICERLGLRVLILPIAVEVEDDRAGTLGDDALIRLARRHALGFHTLTHRAAEEITPATVVAEVSDVVRRLTRIAGRAPRVAAWCGGARFDDRLLGNRRLRELGVTELVSNWSWETIRDGTPGTPGTAGTPGTPGTPGPSGPRNPSDPSAVSLD